MISFPFELIDDGTGSDKPGYLATCRCGGDVFYVFILAEHATNNPHYHIQCAQCEQSHCTGGFCAPIAPSPNNADQELHT